MEDHEPYLRLTRKIMTNVVHIRRSARPRISAEHLHDRIQELYGYPFAIGTYRNLEASRNNRNITQSARLNQELIKAIATALETPLFEILTPEEYAALPPKPFKHAKRHSPRVSTTRRYVPTPKDTAERLRAFMRQYGYNPRTFSVALTFRGYKINEERLRHIFRDRQHLLDHDLLDAAVIVFTRDPADPFDKTRLLHCVNEPKLCPHCHEWIINA